MFVVGGTDSNGKPLDSVEVYDSTTDFWSTTPAEKGSESTGSYGLLCEVIERPTTSPILALLHKQFE